MVAKSYQELEIVTDPYTINNKTYVKVRKRDGAIIQVRWYEEAEYKKYYGAVPASPTGQTQRSAFGFDKGYITIFKGETYPYKDWFKSEGAKYSALWGWYFTSLQDVPPLPNTIAAIRLPWDSVGEENGYLKTDSVVKAEVAKLVQEPSNSKFIGHEGDRLDLHITVTKAIPVSGIYGDVVIHTFEDDDENVYVWKTSVRKLTIGEQYHIKGTLKQHNIYNGVQQNVLTRCKTIED